MTKPRILIQIDPDPQPSTFDSIVAIDSGIDQLLRHSNVTVEQMESLVHGAMFTRGPSELNQTAIFFGGSNVQRSEALSSKAHSCFFGPMRVSIMSDPNGANTTAAAAVVCAENHIDLAGKTIAVLAGTGPVGERISQIVAGPMKLSTPATIRVCSRRMEKAVLTCSRIENSSNAVLIPTQTSTPEETIAAVANADAIFAAGAAGVELLPTTWFDLANRPGVAVDLNAVAPAGIAGIDVTDSGKSRHDTICYGALGVGVRKMKLHKQAIRLLFEANDHVLELDQIYRLAKTVS